MTSDIKNKKATVLCVEDNRINQMILVKALDGLALNIVLASNGVEALALLTDSLADNSSAAHFDLIIMDCYMPEMDGFEATEQIRNNPLYSAYKDVPIIAMTGNDSAENKTRCLDLTMNDFLNKPIEQTLLHKSVIHWLTQRTNPSATKRISPATSENQSKNTSAIWDKGDFLKRVNNNHTLAMQIIHLFLSEMPTACESLLRAIAEENMEQVCLLAHKLKGTANNVSGFKLAIILKRIESLSKEKNVKALNGLSEELSNEFMLLIRHLNAYL